MRRNPLLREADSNCFPAIVGFNKTGRCLGTRCVGVLRGFIHNYTQAHLKQRPLATAWIGLQLGVTALPIVRNRFERFLSWPSYGSVSLKNFTLAEAGRTIWL